jgi:hypothetical protein
MDEIKVGDKVVIYYFAFALEGIVTSIDGNVVNGEITSPLKYFKAPKDYVFPIKEANNETE